MIKNWSIILLILTVRIAYSQVDTLVYNRLRSHVYFLASDSLKGRSTGSVQERVANQYVINQFKVNRKSKNQYWNFSVCQDSNLQCQMVGAFISCKSPYTLLIGAHIDHIGYGGKLSKSPGKKVVHNGADDNAAGVAVLIELQRFFAKRKLPFNLLLVAFTAHEIGTFGSKYISENLAEKYGTLVGVLNFDMIGRLDKQNHNFYISCNQKVDSLFEFSQFIHPVYQDQQKVEILDTKHFLNRMILCANFSTGMHSDYHKNTDDALYINYEGLYQILRYFEVLLEKPSFQQFILINRGV